MGWLTEWFSDTAWEAQRNTDGEWNHQLNKERRRDMQIWTCKESQTQRQTYSQRRHIQTQWKKLGKKRNRWTARQIMRKRRSCVSSNILCNTKQQERSLSSASSQKYPNTILMEKLCAWWAWHGTVWSAVFHSLLLLAVHYCTKRTRSSLIFSDPLHRHKNVNSNQLAFPMLVSEPSLLGFHFKCVLIPETWFIL